MVEWSKTVMKYLLTILSFILLSSCVKDIWNESGKRDPITGEWVKWCPPILRNIDGSCREFDGKEWNGTYYNNNGKKEYKIVKGEWIKQ